MATRDQLHRAVDELSDSEVEHVYALLVSRDATPANSAGIVVDEEYAARVVDALDHPERFEPGLRRLLASAAGRTRRQ
jgi:hypothetical protein